MYTYNSGVEYNDFIDLKHIYNKNTELIAHLLLVQRFRMAS